MTATGSHSCLALVGRPLLTARVSESGQQLRRVTALGESALYTKAAEEWPDGAGPSWVSPLARD